MSVCCLPCHHHRTLTTAFTQTGHFDRKIASTPAYKIVTGRKHKTKKIKQTKQAWTKPEKLDQSCPACCKNRWKSLKVKQPPDVLIVALNRWESNTRAQKTCRRVTTSQTVVFGGSSFSLVGVLYHHGTSKNHGHYTCAVREGGGNWCSIDDLAVVPIADISTWSTSDGYVFFYRR